MIFFSHRMKIEKLFYAWCEKNGIAKKPNSLVAFMSIKGWLNDDAIWKDLHQIPANKEDCNVARF